MVEVRKLREKNLELEIFFHRIRVRKGVEIVQIYRPLTSFRYFLDSFIFHCFAEQSTSARERETPKKRILTGIPARWHVASWVFCILDMEKCFRDDFRHSLSDLQSSQTSRVFLPVTISTTQAVARYPTTDLLLTPTERWLKSGGRLGEIRLWGVFWLKGDASHVMTRWNMTSNFEKTSIFVRVVYRRLVQYLMEDFRGGQVDGTEAGNGRNSTPRYVARVSRSNSFISRDLNRDLMHRPLALQTNG